MTEVTPDNAASATPVAWLDLGRLTEKNMVYATGFKVNDAQSPLYSAATVTALEARIAELEAIIGTGIEGEVVEMGDDEDGNPRVTLHTTRDQIKREARNLMFKQARLIPLTGAGAK